MNGSGFLKKPPPSFYPEKGIDQVVISPCPYLHDGPALASPGTTKDDTTILVRQQ